MLYKASTTPGRDALTPVKTARENVAAAARRLGAGSSLRALVAWANSSPENQTKFWTQLYARTIEKELSVTHEAGDSLTALLAQSYANALPDSEPPSIVEGSPVQVIAAPAETL